MIACPQCEHDLPLRTVVAASSPCPECDTEVSAEFFPAALRTPGGTPPERIEASDDASCFFHEENLARSSCDRCGRFVCSLCEIELDARTVCPTCLDSDYEKGADHLVTERTLWGRTVLLLSLAPLMLFYFTVFTAPITLILGFVFREAPSSLVAKERWRLYLGMTIAALEIAGWAALFGFLIWEVTRG